jgi:hypothetical protein
VSLCAAGVLVGQDVSRVSATLYSFRYAPGLEDVYVRTGPEAFQKVELSTANMVGPITVLAAGGVVTLHRKDVAEDGSERFPSIGKAEVGSVRRPLLVLFPDAKEAEFPYRVLVIDRSATRFPLGSYQFLNLSRYPMRGLVGKAPVLAKPGSVIGVRPEGEPGELMNVVFEYLDGEDWRTMTKTRWALRKDRRSLLCAYLDPRDKRVKVRSIPERVVPLEPETR